MAVVYPYVKQTHIVTGSWTAAKANVVEDGVFNAHNAPAVRAYHNANHSVADSTFAIISMNSERFDQAGGAASTQHDLVTNSSRLTCRYAGIYQIIASATWAANATGIRHIEIYLNNTTTLESVDDDSLGAALAVSQTVTTIYDLAVNDFVELRAWQNSTAALNINTLGTYSPGLKMHRVG